jgi:hypothetical protein
LPFYYGNWPLDKYLSPNCLPWKLASGYDFYRPIHVESLDNFYLFKFHDWEKKQIALEGLRVSIPPGSSPHMAKLIRICMNEDPGKRPNFEMITPILEKMKLQ